MPQRRDPLVFPTVKSAWIWLAAAILIAVSFLYVWQLMIDPRGLNKPISQQVLGEISRALLGEHCRREYKISSRSEAIRYAKEMLAINAKSWDSAGGADAYEAVFNSSSFLNGGSVHENKSDRSWLVADQGGAWEIDFNFANDAGVVASMTIKFSSCGRVENVADLFFRRNTNP